MAEENKVEGTPVPGEYTPTQQKAVEKGWRPKEEWDGDPEAWVSAQEYLRVGEILDKYSSVKGELYQLKRDFGQLTEHYKTVAETEYKRAVNDLKAQRAVAAKEGDTEAVVAISDKIDALQENKPVVQPVTTPPLHPAFVSWSEQNSWYNNDKGLKNQADAISVRIRAENPAMSFEELLVETTKEVKELNPTKFGTVRRTPAVEGTNPSPGRKSSKFTEADLNDTERMVMRNLVNQKVLTKEKYIEDLAKAKGFA